MADAIDFFGDATNYALSFWVLGSILIWPDIVVALIMSGLGISAGWQIIQRAKSELTTSRKLSANG